MSRVAIHFDGRPREYRGPELRSHFARREFGVTGDCAVAFVGPCKVTVDDLVDLEDVAAEAPIFSPLMLHVLVEHFELGLREAVLRQRLLTHLGADLLRDAGVLEVKVSGDDLHVAGRKATVSIATRSPVSAVIHWGLNVRTEGTPVPAWGLDEAGLPADEFARELLGRYQAEIDDIDQAVSKVRGVP